jgi:O-antigen/teichoic acid export membrane protein
MGTRAMLLGVLFVLLSRNLGAEQYGQLAVVVALVSFIYPFVGMGSGMLLLRDIAQSSGGINRQWGCALLVTCITAIPLIIATVIIGQYLLPQTISFRLLVYITLAELMFVPIIELCGIIYQALERAIWSSVFLAGIALFRLGAFLLMLLFTASPEIDIWGLYYLVATMIFAALVFSFTCWDLGAPEWVIPDFRLVFREGFGYSLMNASGKLSVDVDKVMLGRLDNMSTTGLYAAGYRVIDMLFLPLAALLWASISRFFRSGEAGIPAAFRYSLRVLPMPSVYVVVCLLGIFLGARYLPHVFGDEFQGIDTVVYWLSPLLAVLLIRHLLRLVVIGAKSSFIAGVIEIAGALTNIAGNLMLIPMYGWKGAAIATFVSEFTMIASLSVVLGYAMLTCRSQPDTRC